MSGALGGGSVLVHCGGYDSYNSQYTSDCFTVAAAADGALEINSAAPLPRKLRWACHASDGERLVVAGGRDDGDERHDEVLLLEGLNAMWRTTTARLLTPKSS